jgi:glycosyltransferase involved in cell wall biosynthesis
MAKVSVLTAVFNAEKNLAVSIDSILAQSYQDFEFIIIDDGSKDSSSEVISTFKDARIIYLRNERNLGLSASLNRALNSAKGDYIARHDADDVSSPERLKLQAQFLDVNVEVGVVGAQMDVMDRYDHLVAQYPLPTSHGLLAWLLFFDRSLAHPTVMMRKELLERVGGYDESLRVSQDHELWTRLVRLTRFANLSESLVHYRSDVDGRGFLKAQQQFGNRMRARQKLATELLGTEISTTQMRWMDASQKDPCLLSLDQKQTVANLILGLFEAYKNTGILRPEDESNVYPDFLMRLLQVGKCGEGAQFSPARTTTGIRWALRHPDKATQKLLKVGEYSPVNRSVGKIVKQTMVDGLSVIVLAHERERSLEKLLQSLLEQHSYRSPLELILFNNSAEAHLSSIGSGSLPKLIRQFSNCRIINSSYNWGTSARYAIATLASNENILLLDDDLYLRDKYFVSEMAEAFHSLGPLDILSCWNELWIEWDEKTLKTVSLDFLTPGINEITLADTAGPGIAMLNRRVLLEPRVMDMAMQRNRSDAIVSDMGFPLTAALVHGSRCHYFPAWGKLSFHDQAHQGAIYQIPDRHRDLVALFKRLYKSGYKPVLSKVHELSSVEAERVRWAAETLPSKMYYW